MQVLKVVSILLASSMAGSVLADAAEEPDHVWAEYNYGRFGNYLNYCKDWSGRKDYKILFPEADLSCSSEFLKPYAEAQNYVVPKSGISGGFQGKRLFGKWKLVGYEGFWKSEIDPVLWEEQLAAFAEVTIADDPNISWSGSEGDITPEFDNGGIHRIYYQSKKRRPIIPVLFKGPVHSPEYKVTLNNCSNNFPDCMQIQGLNHLGEYTDLDGWFVYKKLD